MIDYPFHFALGRIFINRPQSCGVRRPKPGLNDLNEGFPWILVGLLRPNKLTF
jgi:hypothetical protein